MSGKWKSAKKERHGMRSLKNSCSKTYQVIHPARKRLRQSTVETAKGLSSLGHKISFKSARTATWTLLSYSSREYLKAEMDVAVLFLLGQKIPERKEMQKHLNILRESLYKDCQILKVPSLNLGVLKNTQNHLAQEEQQLQSSMETLELLQGEINQTLRVSEQLDEEIRSLQQKIQLLQCEEAEEKKQRKNIPLSSTGVLSLSQLSKCNMGAPSLQSDVLCIGEQVGLLKDLNTVHNSAVITKVQMLLEHAYAKTEGL